MSRVVDFNLTHAQLLNKTKTKIPELREFVNPLYKRSFANI